MTGYNGNIEKCGQKTLSKFGVLLAAPWDVSLPVTHYSFSSPYHLRFGASDTKISCFKSVVSAAYFALSRTVSIGISPS